MPLPKPSHIVLASGSPRRRELLGNLRLDFEIFVTDIDETIKENEAPQTLVKRLSNAKATSAAQKYPKSLVIAADTVVVLKGKILGKPKNPQENHNFLAMLSGQTHKVYTGYALNLGGEKIISTLKSKVTFRHLSTKEIQQYVATNEGMDKAGGYGIQNFGASMIKKISGCYFNIVGLSLSHIVDEVKKLGVRLV